MSALGSLVVKLGLDYAQYTGGLDKSEQAALAAAKKIQDTFDGMKARVAATAGAIAGGLAAGFTISAFRSIISGSIETGAALDDLRMQTGSTVEALSGLVAVGKFNNMGPEQIGAAMNKLSANLASATEEGKGAGKALEALGIDFDKFKLMRPEEQMQTVAKAMAGFEDGTGKAAVAMALYGKQGAQMLPFLHDLAEVGDLQAKVSTEQAAAAANLDDNLTRLSTSGEAWKKELANGMIPALDLGAQALVDMMNGSGGLREEVRRLVADGSIKQWTTDAIKGLSYVADAAQLVWRSVQFVTKGFTGLAAAAVQALQGNFRGAWEVLKASGEDMIDTFNSPTIGQRFRESLDKVAASAAATGDAAAKARPSLDGFANTTDKAAKTATAAKDPFDALRDSIIKATAAYQAEATAGEKLTEGQKRAIDVLDQLRTGKVRVTEAQAIQIGKDIEAMLAAEGENKARQESVKISQAAADARRKEADAIADFLRAQEEAASAALHAVQDRIISLRDEEQAVEISRSLNISLAEAVERVAIARLQEKQAGFYENSEGWKNLRREIEERQKLLGLIARKDVREREERGWTDMWSSVDRTAHDVFVNIFDGGTNVFKKLGQTLKASVLDLLYQMTVRKWIISIGATLLGGGFGAAANAATGNTASTLSSGLNIFSGLQGTEGMLGKIGTFLGTNTVAANTALAGTIGIDAASAAAAANGAAAAGGSLMSTIGSAMPYLGMALAAVSLLKGLDDSGTFHTGALSQYSAAGGLANSTSHGAFGMGFGGVDYSAETEKFTGAMAQSIVQMLDSTATTFGKEAGYKAATAFADDTSKDGAWGGLLISKLEETIINWDAARTSKWAPKEFADGAAGKEQYLAAVAADVRVALDSIGLPAWATSMLDKLGQGATLEQLAAAVDQINSGKLALQRLGAIMPSLADLSDEVTSALAAASGGMGALTGNLSVFYSEFFTDAERSAVVMGELQAEVDKLGLTMPATREEFRALVQQQIAAGEDGAEAAAKLLSLGGAFASAVPWIDTATQASEANTVAVDDAARAAEEAAKKWQSITDALLGDRDGLAIELLRAQGQEEAALAAERARAIEGYDAYQVALWDANKATRDRISALEAEAEAAKLAAERAEQLREAIANELPAAVDQYLSPAARERAQYDRIAADLGNAGIGVSAAALQGATKEQIAQAAMAIYNMAETSDTARLAIVRAAGALAGLKDQAEATAKTTALESLDRAWQAVQRAQQAEREVLTDTIADVRAVFDVVRAAARDLYGEVDSIAALQAEQGRAFISQALSTALTTGMLPEVDALRDAVAAARTGLDASAFASVAEADYQKMVVAAQLTGLRDAAGDQLTEAERQLQALDELVKSESAQIELLRAQLEGQAAGTEATLSIAQAVQALHETMAGIRNGRGGGGGGGGGGLATGGAAAAAGVLNGPRGSQYDPRSDTFYAAGTGLPYLGADLGAAAIAAVQAGNARDVYDLATQYGATSDMLAKWTGANAQDLRDWALAQGLPSFAGGGMHKGGWAVVGEDGPEVAYLPPARIYTTSESARMLGGQGGSGGGSQVVDLLATIAARLEAIEESQDEGAKSARRTADLLDKTTAGGSGIYTMSMPT